MIKYTFRRFILQINKMQKHNAFFSVKKNYFFNSTYTYLAREGSESGTGGENC
jgi:hypothetical protein